MATKILLRPPLPFVDPEDENEIKTYFTTNGGYTVESTVKPLPNSGLGIILTEDLDAGQKATLKTTIEGDGECVVYVDEF